MGNDPEVAIIGNDYVGGSTTEPVEFLLGQGINGDIRLVSSKDVSKRWHQHSVREF